MPAGFVNATLALHNRPISPPLPPLAPLAPAPLPAHKVFVSFDGRGDASGLRDMGCVFSSVLDGR